MENDIAISVKDLHKSFRLPTERAWGLKQAIFNRLKGIKGYKEQKVLRGIDFDIYRNEFVGIVGRNGSGKSTLLKTLAKIYFPEKGSVTINGNLIPFIELGVGFNYELSGRENVYLNGALLGFSNKEMDAMYDEIVDFAEQEVVVSKQVIKPKKEVLISDDNTIPVKIVGTKYLKSIVQYGHEKTDPYGSVLICKLKQT